MEGNQMIYHRAGHTAYLIVYFSFHGNGFVDGREYWLVWQVLMKPHRYFPHYYHTKIILLAFIIVIDFTDGRAELTLILCSVSR